MLIASCSSDIKFHTWPDGKQQNSYKPVTAKNKLINTISWGKDGSWLSLVPDDSSVEIITVKDHIKHLHTVKDVSDPTSVVFQNTTKRHIAVGTKSGQVLVYDVKARKIRKKFAKVGSAITGLEFSVKDTHLIASCEKGELMLYNYSVNALSTVYKIPNCRTLSTFRWHPFKKSLVAAGSEEGIVAVWDTNTNKTICKVQMHSAPVTNVAFSPARTDMIVSLGLDRKFCFYDIVSNTCCYEFSVEKSLTAADFYSDSTGLVMGSQNGQIFIYDTRNMKEPQTSFSAHDGLIKKIAFQKINQGENSICSIPEDKIVTNQVEEIVNADSFGVLADVVEEPNPPPVAEQKTEVTDSFLDVLGTSSSVATPSIIVEPASILSDNKEVEIKSNSLHRTNKNPLSCTPGIKAVQFIENGVQNKSKFSSPNNAKGCVSSTPNCLSADSPRFFFNNLPGQNQGQQSSGIGLLKPADLENIRSIVREEINNFKTEMRYEMMDMFMKMRKEIVGLSWSIHKCAYDTECAIDRLRENINLEDDPDNAFI